GAGHGEAGDLAAQLFLGTGGGGVDLGVGLQADALGFHHGFFLGLVDDLGAAGLGLGDDLVGLGAGFAQDLVDLLLGLGQVSLGTIRGGEAFGDLLLSLLDG